MTKLIMLSANISSVSSSNGTMNGSCALGVTFPGLGLNRLEAQIIYYAKLFFIVIGLFGNFLSCYVWTTKYFRRVPHSVVCFTLAVTNTMYLTINFQLSTVDYVFQGDIKIASHLSCQVLACLHGFSQHVDSWLIVLLSLERSIGVFSHHFAKIAFNRLKALIYVVLIIIILLAFNIFFATQQITFEQRLDGSKSCKVEDILSIEFKIREYMNCLIPLSVIIPCNILIVVKVIFQIRSMRGVIAVTQQQALKKKSIKVTVLTLSITLSFLILTLPMNVIAFCCTQTHSGIYFAVFVTLLPHINASIDCYMYALSSREFRRKVKSVLVTVITLILSSLTSLCAQNSVAPAGADIPI